MKAAITASEFRSNVYRLLDRVADTGTPLTIARKGRRLKVVCDRKEGRLARLVRRSCIKGDPEDIVHMDWSGEWKHDLP
jgi:prevent-host-death family protein